MNLLLHTVAEIVTGSLPTKCWRKKHKLKYEIVDNLGHVPREQTLIIYEQETKSNQYVELVAKTELIQIACCDQYVFISWIGFTASTVISIANDNVCAEIKNTIFEMLGKYYTHFEGVSASIKRGDHLTLLTKLAKK